MELNWAAVAVGAVSLAAWLAIGTTRRGVLVGQSKRDQLVAQLGHYLPDWLRPIPGRRRSAALGAGMAGLVALLTSSSWGWIALPSALVVAGVAYFTLSRLESAQQRRYRELLSQQSPSTIELLAAQLQAGAPLRVALADLAELSEEPTASFLGDIAAHVSIGRSESEALLTAALCPTWGPIARDLARSSESGAAMADMLVVHAQEARRAHRDRAEARAKTVAVRSVLPMMICFLPAFILVGVVPIIAGTIGNFLVS